MDQLERYEPALCRILCRTTSKTYNISGSEKNAWKIGRHYSNDLVVKSLKISGFQCALTFIRGIGLVLTDLSTNGTQVNGIRVGKGMQRVIRPGDVISLEGLKREFVYYQDHKALPPTSIWRKYFPSIELGRGSFGTVYKCNNPTTGSTYAIKVIDIPQFRQVRNADRMFRNEVRILRTLNSKHENIVQLKEIYQAEQKLCIVLEYAAGGDLRKYLQKNPPLAENVAAGFMKQICKGVAFIHEQGVVHRDLKPANILLSEEEPPRLKIADFGLAKLVDAGSILRTQCGTLDYLAPEVIRRIYVSTGYTNKVDGWSIGVIVFEMLTKKLPFQWNLAPQINYLNKQSERIKDLQPLSAVKCSSRCINFIERLLQETPSERSSVERALRHEWLHFNATPSLLFLPPPPHHEETLLGEPGDTTWEISGA